MANIKLSPELAKIKAKWQHKSKWAPRDLQSLSKAFGLVKQKEK